MMIQLSTEVQKMKNENKYSDYLAECNKPRENEIRSTTYTDTVG